MFTAFFLTLLLLTSVPNSLAQTFLLATDTGVQVFSANVTAPTIIHSQPASAIHFRYNKDVYSIFGSQIFYTFYSKVTNGYVEHLPFVKHAKPLTDLVVDWLHFRLYFADGTGVLYSARLLGSSIKQVYKASQLEDLAVDPYGRLLFFIEDGALVSLGMDSLEKRRYKLGSRSLTKVSRVAVDLHTRKVYVVGSVSAGDDDQWHLVATDYQDEESRLVFNGTEVSGVVALDVFNDQVTWAGHTDDRYTIYTCSLSPDCATDDLKVISQSNKVIRDLKFFSPMAHAPSEDAACDLLNCSHNCSVVSSYSVRCTCPEGMTVEANDNVCRASIPSRDISSWLFAAMHLAVLVFEALFRWFTSSPHPAKALILVCCALMAVLAFSGLCVLMTMKRPKRRVRRNECYRLSERNNSHTPRTTR